MNMKEKNELISVLERFQEGYIKRDLSSIDVFMDDLFEKNDNMVIIGTGCDEWCLGFKEVKEIFLSDWEYWGDLRININDALMDTEGEEIKDMLKGFQKSYLNGNISSSEIVDKYFSKKRTVAVDTGILMCTGTDSIKGL